MDDIVHVLATDGNILLFVALVIYWREMKAAVLIQTLLVALMVAHNVQWMHGEAIDRWFSFDQAETAAAWALFPVLSRNSKFWTRRAGDAYLALVTIILFEYMQAEDGYHDRANQIYYVRVWVSIFVDFSFAAVLYARLQWTLPLEGATMADEEVVDPKKPLVPGNEPEPQSEPDDDPDDGGDDESDDGGDGVPPPGGPH